MVHAFLDSEISFLEREKATFHIIPAPWEQTVSYGHGTADGPRAILEASDQLELWDGICELATECGLFTTDQIDGNQSVKSFFESLEKEVSLTLKMGKIPFVLGGEHSLTYGALQAVKKHFGAGQVGIVQFDAHADLRDQYEGSPWSHACAMRRALELGFPLFQIANRALCKEEVQLRKLLQIPHLDGDEITDINIETLSLPLDFPENIYISFDIDGLDGAIMPATGTPVPCGLNFPQALTALRRVCKGRRVIGMDMVEFAPIKDFHAYDFSAALLCYKMMSIAWHNNRIYA